MEGTEISVAYRRPPIAIKLHTDGCVMTISLMHCGQPYVVVICIHLARRCVSTTPELKYGRLDRRVLLQYMWSAREETVSKRPFT